VKKPAKKSKAVKTKPAHHKRVAEEFGVVLTLVYKWEKKGWPIHDLAALAKVVLADPRAYPETIDKVKAWVARQKKPEPRATPETQPTKPAPKPKEAIKDAEGDELEEVCQSLKRHMDVIWSKLQDPEIDAAELKLLTNLHNETSKTLVANRLALKRLGVESGDMIPRAEVVRIVTAIASRMVVGFHAVISEAAPKLVGVDDIGKASDILQSIGVPNMIVNPLRTASRTRSGVTIPDWLVDAFDGAIKDYVEE
jgi:hypothetical protein